MNLDIAAYLATLVGKERVVFCPNPGNAGDALIAHATFQLFDEIKLPYELYDENTFKPDQAVLIHGGGGGMLSAPNSVWRLIERHHAAVKRLIVLPQTICGQPDLLGKLGPNVDLFARDPVSFAFIQKHAVRANLFIADDMAFRLNPAQILASKPGWKVYFAKRPLNIHKQLQELLFWTRTIVGCARPCKPRVLYCFRTDSEKTTVLRPRGNADLSKLCVYGTATPQQAFLSTHAVFRAIHYYDEVHTNRLHMMIAGALLGKAVRGYPNGYYKCQAVYRHSIQKRFPNVQWMGTTASA